MKEVWVCRCSAVHSTEEAAQQCDCTFNGYTHRYECQNCGALLPENIPCCFLFFDDLQIEVKP